MTASILFGVLYSVKFKYRCLLLVAVPALISYLIQQCTQSNGIVLDGFLGSASTLVACEQLDRICYGVELEPKFVDVAVKRYIALKDGVSDDVYVVRNGETIPYSDICTE